MGLSVLFKSESIPAELWSEPQQPSDTNDGLRGPVISALGVFGSASFGWKGVSLSTKEKVHDTSPT